MNKSNKFHILTISLIAFWIQIVHAGGEIHATETAHIVERQGRQSSHHSKNHALLIGVSVYFNGWHNLPRVKEDVVAIRSVLENGGFDVRTVLNPNQNQLIRAFESFIRDYGGEEDARLLFYYAGHGYTVKSQDGDDALGYIVPREAPDPDKSEHHLANFKHIAMSMKQIEAYALSIYARQALFVFDSCLSGSGFAVSKPEPGLINHDTHLPVRQFITTGGTEGKEPDQSTFCEQFVLALEGEADIDGDKILTGTELGIFLQTNVFDHSDGTQHSLYGKIRNPELDKGDFIFESKGDVNEPQVSVQSEPYKAEGSGIDNRFGRELESEKRLNETEYKMSEWQKRVESAFDHAVDLIYSEHPDSAYNGTDIGRTDKKTQ